MACRSFRAGFATEPNPGLKPWANIFRPLRRVVFTFRVLGLPVNRIAANILRIENGILVEHWDVIQDEATKEQSKSGNPMFGDSFPVYP